MEMAFPKESNVKSPKGLDFPLEVPSQYTHSTPKRVLINQFN